MERYPSKVGLFITRMCNIISGGLVAFGLSSFLLFLYPKWLGWSIAVAICGFSALATIASWINTYKTWYFYFPISKIRRRGDFPDQWQWQWIRHAYHFGLNQGEEWRTLQAIIGGFIALCLTCVFETWRYPEYAPQLGKVWPLYLCFSFLIGSLCFIFGRGFGQQRPKHNPPGRPNDEPPDDFDPAGIGARIIPPSPTLSAGSQYPMDDERYA